MADLIISIIGYILIWSSTDIELLDWSYKKKWTVKIILISIGGFLIDVKW